MVELRAPVERLRMNGISGIAVQRIDDPAVIPLWFGEGDLPTPAFICDAAKHAMDTGGTFYTHPRGGLPIRNALKDYLDALYRTDINPDRITVPGSTMLGITLACQVTCSEGDHGLIVSPNWPNITNTFELTGAQVSYVRQRYENGQWSLPLADILAGVRPNTKAIFVNTPCNPHWLGDAGVRPTWPARILPRARYLHHRRRGLSPACIRRLGSGAILQQHRFG